MEYWGMTDVGRVRSENQDAWRIESLDRHTVVMAVCDGMGGAKSGHIASKLAIDVFVEEVMRAYKPGLSQEQVEQMVVSAVKLANFAVFDQSQKVPECAGMGTTLVGAFLWGKNAAVVNVGDSRCYLIGNGGIRRITVDHSLVQMMLMRGDLTPEEARVYPGKNYITRAVGTEPTVKCDLFSLRLERGDTLLLCSDGLHGELDDQEILFEVLHGGSHEDCCERLRQIVTMRGAPDNLTAALLVV